MKKAMARIGSTRRGRSREKEKQNKIKGKRTTSRAKGNLTNKTEVNLLRKPKSMAQPHPVRDDGRQRCGKGRRCKRNTTAGTERQSASQPGSSGLCQRLAI